jgi:hypothetical protein
MLEEDKGFTIRRAAASKQASREKFQNRRDKEQGAIETKKTGSAGDISALRKEQDKLAQERERLQKEKEVSRVVCLPIDSKHFFFFQSKKEARQKRDSGSFGDRLKQRTDQKQKEAAQKEAELKQAKKVEKVNTALASWAGTE